MDALIIADNLTGAAGTGIKFAGPGPVKLAGLGGAPLSSSPGALALDTDTRNRQDCEIPAVLAGIKPFLGPWKPRLIFKKIDSCLRGYAGLETNILTGLFDFRCALVAPACPELGRT
ncbi:MAG: four-carbon acid sugar kinase family protein, partial [Deltaproteobacteria bacterium]|nr:four-carbon acid sugar kinase family protein [Deltaproteobacteria bacterium]